MYRRVNSLLNPAFIGSISFFLVWSLGKCGDESNVPFYNLLLLYPFILFCIGVFYAWLSWNKVYVFIPKSIPRFILLIAIFSIVVNLARIYFIVPVLGSFNPRLIEAHLAGSPIITQIGFLGIPFLYYYNLVLNKSKTERFVYYLSFISVIIIPIKTHIITAVIIVLIAKYFSKTINYYKVVILLVFILALVPLFSILRFAGAKEIELAQGFDSVGEDFITLEIKKNTTYNISNLALEYDNKYPLTFGQHIFGQFLDPVVYIFTLGNKRIINREETDGGIRHPIDGRYMNQFSEGSNMGTAIRPFIYDFGMLGSFLAVFIFYFLVNFFYFLLLKGKSNSFILAIMINIGFFTFWDFDWFETRYLFWGIIIYIFTKWRFLYTGLIQD